VESEHATPFGEESFVLALADRPRPFGSAKEIAAAMRCLLAEGLTDLPLPGGGNTRERWRALASVGALDLSLVRRGAAWNVFREQKLKQASRMIVKSVFLVWIRTANNTRTWTSRPNKALPLRPSMR